MAKAVGGIFGLILSLILFIGLNAVNQFSQDDAAIYIGQSAADFIKKWKLFLYITIGTLFVLQQVWLRWPKPASRSDIQDMKEVIESLLKQALDNYYSSVPSASSPAAPAVRINIMLPTWRRFKFGRYLKIYYAYGGPAGVRYPDNERDLCWRKKNGTCGHAWAKERTVIYDSENENLRAPGNTLSPEQQAVVGSVKSVISVPIWSKVDKSVVGVLNLDSKFNVDRTLFDQEVVAQRAEVWARVFPKMLFRDGVKPN